MIKEFIIEFFSKKDKLSLTPQDLKEFTLKNRNSLKKINTWIDKDALKKSYFEYGAPDSIKRVIDIPLDETTTYSDLILFYSKYFDVINYLELGVSLGKNFFQLADNFQSAHLVGFDIEDINPPLSQNFKFIASESWEGKETSLRKDVSTKNKYAYNSNSIEYIASDIWDEDTWARMSSQQFNIIFSDALHDPKALLWEFEMIKKYNLLSDKFLFIWDDLNHGLEKSFYTIATELKTIFNLKDNQIKKIKVNGWVGNNEKKHDVGIITNVTDL